MKKFKIFISILAVYISANSCNDYLDINENPNAIHQENILPSLIIPGAISQTHRIQATSMMRFGNLMMNSWAGNSYVFAGPFSDESILSAVNSSFYDEIWDGIYTNVNNFSAVENFPNNNHKQDNYIIIAKIMKAFYLQYIVDLYGDAPYSEAFKGLQNLAPKYDNDSDIYKALIANLDEAIILKNTANANAEDAGASDIIFHGDMDKWEAFANTVKLRYLLRMSNVTGELATYRNQQLATLSGATFINEDVLENPGYNSSNDDSMNPFFLTYRLNSAGSAPQNYNLVTASEHIAISLNGNNFNATESYYTKFNGIIDPRRSRLFSLITYNGVAQVKGIRQGAAPGQPGVPLDNTSVSKLGAGNFSGSAALSLTSGNRAGVIMSLAESKLLQAEASVRYPAFFSGGEDNFKQAIIASATWVGVPIPVPPVTIPITPPLTMAQVMAPYITAISVRPGLGWTGTNAQKIEAIMTQKWLALTNVNPTEMFIEYNRTGFPVTPMAANSIQANKPYRLVYPTSEYVSNSANVPSFATSAVFTKNQYTPFWNQN
jgi:hypothetical protein